MSKEYKFSDDTLALAQRIIKRYPEGKQKSALIPLLHLAQMEFDGWLSAPAMDYVASLLKIQPIEVYEVASFYSMFNLKPVGKCLIEVCRTGPCWLLGAEDIVRHIEKKLNIKDGETTADGMFTLKTVECLAACGTAPVIQVGETYHENMTCEKTDEMLDEYRRKGQVVTHFDKKHVKAGH
ncbi:MAG: NADH-quinone oxidoreductase subunit NuoE [Bacteroidia bacterium]